MEQKSKVLVVEDDAGIRQSLFETLGALGFAIGEACNGEEALLRLRMVNYDAVLLDINMPGIGGKETCRRICQSYPRLPIIMLTVRDDENDKVEALDAGAYDYVTKPFQIHQWPPGARGHPALQRLESIERSQLSRRHHAGLRTSPGAKRGEDIHLAPKQYETLCYLMEHAGHQCLTNACWLRFGDHSMATSGSTAGESLTSYARRSKTIRLIRLIS